MLLISENYRYFLKKKILAIRLWNNCCISNAYICISLHGILTKCDRLYVVLKQQKLNQKFVLSVQWHAVTLSSVYSKIKNGNIALGVSTQKTFRLCRFIVNYHPVTKNFSCMNQTQPKLIQHSHYFFIRQFYTLSVYKL